jgi:hypothetical protein
MRSALFFLSLSWLVLLATAHVRAQAPAALAPREATLTSRGRLLLAGDLLGNWSNDGPAVHGSLSRWEVDGSVKLLHFVRDQIGIGASAGGGASARYLTSSSSALEERANHVRTGVHAAFDVPLTARLSLLLQPALLYFYQWLTVDVASSPFDAFGGSPPSAGATFQQQATLSAARRVFTLSYVRLALSVPLVVHVSNSVGLGFGPSAWLDFIVHRQPIYGRELLQRPAYYEDDEASDPVKIRAPRRTRFQVGLFTTILVAL